MLTLSCEKCGSNFDVYPSKSDKKYCSRECWSNSSRIEKNCTFCDEDFWTYKSEDKKYCSDECYRKDNSKVMVDVECEFCDNIFQKSEAQIEEYPSHYCDKSCAAMDQPRTGNDFNYDLYGKNWEKNRKRALERDNHECQICGTDESLEVHHIKGRKYFYDEELETVSPEANELENLVTLCHKHHNKLEGMFVSEEPEAFINQSKDLLESHTNSESQ